MTRGKCFWYIQYIEGAWESRKPEWRTLIRRKCTKILAILVWMGSWAIIFLLLAFSIPTRGERNFGGWRAGGKGFGEERGGWKGRGAWHCRQGTDQGHRPKPPPLSPLEGDLAGTASPNMTGRRGTCPHQGVHTGTQLWSQKVQRLFHTDPKSNPNHGNTQQVCWTRTTSARLFKAYFKKHQCQRFTERSPHRHDCSVTAQFLSGWN